MTTIIYGDISILKGKNIDVFISKIPLAWQSDVKRYKMLDDVKTRLLARLMLLYALKQSKSEHLANNWQRDTNNKPLIGGWYNFNISHSGTKVVLSYSNFINGIDIQELRGLDFKELINFFHPGEREILISTTNVLNKFYEIWVKKEAVLKAIGTGLLNGLDEFCCVDDVVTYNDATWHLSSIYVFPNYLCYLASQEPLTDAVLQEFGRAHLDCLER